MSNEPIKLPNGVLHWPQRIVSTPEEAVKRARSQIGVPWYKLGAGGRNPFLANCGKKQRPPSKEGEPLKPLREASDCIGLVCWSWGFDRLNPKFPVYGGWINTDSIVQSLTKSKDWFIELDAPRYGALIVYPGIYVNGERARTGHIGLITEHHKDDAVYDWNVIHCSASRKGVRETMGTAWYEKEIFRSKVNQEWRARIVWPAWVPL